MKASGLQPNAEQPLAAFTSLGLGGPAELLARIDSAESLPLALAWAQARGLAVTLLGGGSNVVVADTGVRGLVLTLGFLEQSSVRDGDRIDVSVGAGESWDRFVAVCVERNWAGLECLSGIPGQVGATPIQNVGAYGQEVADCLVSVDAFDCKLQQRVRLSHSECAFGYRTSRFKAADAGRFIVVGVTFRLREGGPACLSYPEVAQHFAPREGKPAASLRRVREAVLATRRLKSMLLEPLDENARSCGSFFLNPQLTLSEFEQLCERCVTRPPAFPQSDGRLKVPAAWLIEQAGFQRGQRFGPVGISSRHTLALVCHAGATARHLLEAAHRVRDGVARAFAVSLTPEPCFLGFGPVTDGLPPLR